MDKDFLPGLLVCITPMVIFLFFFAILGWKLKTWYVKNLMRLDREARLKIQNSSMNFSIVGLIFVLIFLAGMAVALILGNYYWLGSIRFFGLIAFIGLVALFEIFTYLNMYFLIRKHRVES